MSHLFDISPLETDGKRKKKPHETRVSIKKTEPEKSSYYLGKSPPRLFAHIGTIDHTYACWDHRCQAECNDILVEDGRQWLLQCVVCGCTQWVPVIPGHLQPKEEGFVFRDGRFAGLTIDEAVALPRGLDYVEWAAKEHKRPAVKQACQTWLDGRKATA